MLFIQDRSQKCRLQWRRLMTEQLNVSSSGIHTVQPPVAVVTRERKVLKRLVNNPDADRFNERNTVHSHRDAWMVSALFRWLLHLLTVAFKPARRLQLDSSWSLCPLDSSTTITVWSGVGFTFKTPENLNKSTPNKPRAQWSCCRVLRVRTTIPCADFL